MQSLLEKIESNAATRLTLPPGKLPTEELARFKAFLKVETHRVKLLHRSGGGGREVCRARAAILDVLLRYLWNASKASLSEQAQKEFPPLALVAIGGYGRAELNPFSDIDFMFLHDGQVVMGGRRPLPHLAKLIDGILYPLWDLGLKVGHSVRSIEDCVSVANTDMQSKTSLIEARLITGSDALFKKFQKTLLNKCVGGYVEQYIAMRLEDQAARRAKFGNSASMQEPNLKNGCGGLRDYQNLLWMTFFKYGTRSLAELQKQEFVSDAERRQLEAAYDFLLRVRTDMHYHTNRATDVLSKALQPAIAHNLGFTERSPSKRIEKFMRDLYTHSRNIYIITRTLEQRMALVPQPGFVSSKISSLTALIPGKRKKEVQEPVDGFKFIKGEIHAVSNRVFRDQPRRLMRVFLYAQQRGLRLHPDLAQLIRKELSLADREFLNDQHVRETFFTILAQRGNVAPILRAMHEVGLLGKYIPEFGKLTCLVQHEFYHQYTADEHTLVCLEQVDKIWEAKAPATEAYAPLLQKLERPFLLYLSLLLHDTGKPTGHGNHAEVGANIAMRVARRLRLDGSASHVLRVLVENHLLMASVSQRRDLDDPLVIRNFSTQVQNPETLDLLTLLTFADAQATSDKLWNGFKDALLWSLYKKAAPLLTGGSEFIRAEEKQRELLMEEVSRLGNGSISNEELEALFATLPPRYFQIHTAREIFEDLIVAHRFMRLQISEEDSPLTPVVNWHNEPDRGYNTVKVCTWDRAGLFTKIAGSFSALGLNILSAQIFTRTDGIVLDEFFVTDAKSGSLAERGQRDEFEKLLNRVLTDEDVDFHGLIARHKIIRPMYQAYTGEQMPTRVHFDNEDSEARTLIEIETEDRVGLLYVISEVLTEFDLDISAAKILTEKGAAIDSFYVREIDGGKILAPERQRAIERKLHQAIRSLDEALKTKS
jgi:[protein-PII] uridylyltransferase